MVAKYHIKYIIIVIIILFSITSAEAWRRGQAGYITDNLSVILTTDGEKLIAN